MAVEYSAGGNKFSRGSKKVLSIILGIAIIYIILVLIAAILSLFGINGLVNVLDKITIVADKILYHVFFAIQTFLVNSGIWGFLDTYAIAAITAIFIVSFFWKLIFRGYWKLITRPYMVVMTIIGFTIFSVVSIYMELESTYSYPIVELLNVIQSFFPQYEGEISSIFNFISMADLSFIFAYYVIMWVLCRIQVWLSFSSKYMYLLPSEARDLCIAVLKEARKKAWGLPMRMKFYVVPDKSFNAFAFAHDKVAINTGTLEGSDQEVLRGIIAHELGHIAHLDVTANVIAQTNFLMMFFAISLPWLIVSGFAPREGERVNVFTYLIWVFFFALMRIIQSLINSVHYVCYLIGGKRSEYAADKFAVKIGEGTGILRFMAAYIDEPSGGFSDPHPSMRNRLSHVLKWIEGTKHENYKGLDTKSIRSALL